MGGNKFISSIIFLQLGYIIWDILEIMFLLFFCFFTQLPFDLYKSLGVGHDSSYDEIESSYNKINKRIGTSSFHNPDGLSIESIKFAYETLINSEYRRIYDFYGFEAVSKRRHNNRANTTSQSPIHRKMKTLQTKVALPISYFYTGCTYEIAFLKREVCRCPHRGYICEKCSGNPTNVVPYYFYFQIAPGTPVNHVYIFENITDSTELFGSGNVEVMVIEKPDQTYRREGNNLITKIFITEDENHNGFHRRITLPNGNSVSVNHKKRKGNVIIVKNKGFNIIGKANESGDLIVHVEIKRDNN